MEDIVELGIRRYSEVYKKEMDDLGLSLYQKYSRKDICRLLNWEKDESSFVHQEKRWRRNGFLLHGTSDAGCLGADPDSG